MRTHRWEATTSAGSSTVDRGEWRWVIQWQLLLRSAKSETRVAASADYALERAVRRIVDIRATTGRGRVPAGR
ncbi:hypothetical protein SAMN05660662_2354 [Blastococcus aurantiacus]|uniref:Uncharacterized protein n=1 Tax=Blastococcus aurantiacus TaxID=1550231 RepID=A0A1G7LJ73_9ACTN|nr:hypothetical protein [Blastococcus aurantiacus]SDF49582.1 hypothetical protein SAMN05660662_2354 [Blastococcus aurantiacus]